MLKRYIREMKQDLGKFDVLYADPPWSYAEVPYFKKSLAIQYKYPTLSQAEMMKLDVESISKKNSWCFMWAVWAQLKHAIELMEAWGFSYRTCAFVWAKKTKNGKNAKTFGRCATQGSTEIVLVGKKGSPKRHALNVEQFVETVRRGNSQKPDEIYDRIDKIVEPPMPEPTWDRCFTGGLLKDCPTFNKEGCHCESLTIEMPRKLEIFARQQWGGWYALGNDDSLKKDSEFCIYGDIRDIIGPKQGEEFKIVKTESSV
jgi:N6-adenosine-specific RNA methylase IME4